MFQACDSLPRQGSRKIEDLCPKVLLHHYLQAGFIRFRCTSISAEIHGKAATERGEPHCERMFVSGIVGLILALGILEERPHLRRVTSSHLFTTCEDDPLLPDNRYASDDGLQWWMCQRLAPAACLWVEHCHEHRIPPRQVKCSGRCQWHAGGVQ